MTAEKKKKRKDLTLEELKELFHYNELTGDFIRLVTRSWNAKAGDVAGCIDSEGYRVIRINYKLHRANRLAWFYTYRVWPEDDVDHIDGDKSNNILTNLRDCSRSSNSANRGKNSNNKSGLKGVSWKKNKRDKKWRAQIQHNKEVMHLGYFDSKIEAGRAYDRAAKKYQTIYAKPNFPEEWDGMTYIGVL